MAQLQRRDRLHAQAEHRGAPPLERWFRGSLHSSPGRRVIGDRLVDDVANLARHKVFRIGRARNFFENADADETLARGARVPRTLAPGSRRLDTVSDDVLSAELGFLPRAP